MPGTQGPNKDNMGAFLFPTAPRFKVEWKNLKRKLENRKPPLALSVAFLPKHLTEARSPTPPRCPEHKNKLIGQSKHQSKQTRQAKPEGTNILANETQVFAIITLLSLISSVWLMIDSCRLTLVVLLFDLTAACDTPCMDFYPQICLHLYIITLHPTSFGVATQLMSSALYVLLLFSALWTLSLCVIRQFHLVSEPKTWTGAQSYCRENFTDLATIESQQEMNAVKAALNGTGGNFWIGLKVPLILINQNKTWGEALRYCRENHVDLVSVHNATIQQWVEVITENTSTANVWMGLRHTCTLSFWFWVSGESMCYQNWAPGNGTGVEDCSGVISFAGTDPVPHWKAPYGRLSLALQATPQDRTVMSSALYVLLLFSALWTLSLCGTRHFHLVNKQKNWTEAQSYCREKFTDLATIESQKEMDALIAVLNGRGGRFWIGLKQKDLQDNTNWTWSDGSDSSYRYWNTGEPNYGKNEMCVQLLHNSLYRWNDAGCHQQHQFICYTNSSTELPLILINQNKTWSDALWYCRENHVDLVSVHTEEVQHWVEGITKNTSTANVWMGLRHTCTLNFWFWVSGESMCYQNWAPGNGTGVEDCSGGERTGAVQSGSKQWVSLPETQTLNFICSVEGKSESSISDHS
ncbi:hypothetical protein NFI96_031298 [Prochilodus magdalenae]|nr:hypothetical protein NFI96_031298 [Prochilodus magdalenae]